MTAPADDRNAQSRRKGSNRREFLAASGSALAAVSMLGLAACGDDDSGGGGGSLIISTSVNNRPLVAKQIKQFNQQNPDRPNVELRQFSNDTSQYFGSLRTQFQAGGGDVSVITGDVIWPAQFAEPGWITDLDKRFTSAEQEKFLPGTVEAMRYQGKIYGVPWFTDSGLLYYRQDLLEDAGFSDPPATYDELKEMAQKIQRDGGAKWGFVWTGANYEGGTVLGTEFIRNAGGDILDGDKVTIGSPEAITGLEMMRSLVADGIAPEAVGNYQEDQATAAFGRGDAAFMRMWPFYYTQLKDPEIAKIKTSQVGLGKVPVVAEGVKGTNVGGGWNFYISTSADNQDAASALVEYMSAEKQQKQMTLELGVLPTRKAVYKEQAVIDAQPAVKFATDAILTTSTPPVSPYYSDMSLAMSEQFKANAVGQTSPEDAAGTLQDKLQSIIDKGG